MWKSEWKELTFCWKFQVRVRVRLRGFYTIVRGSVLYFEFSFMGKICATSDGDLMY